MREVDNRNRDAVIDYANCMGWQVQIVKGGMKATRKATGLPEGNKVSAKAESWAALLAAMTHIDMRIRK